MQQIRSEKIVSEWGKEKLPLKKPELNTGTSYFYPGFPETDGTGNYNQPGGEFDFAIECFQFFEAVVRQRLQNEEVDVHHYVVTLYKLPSDR